MLVDVVSILACFIVIAESLYLHAVQTILLIDDEVEITHEIGSEVIFRHLEEQLVLVYRIGNVGEHEDERLVALDAEYLCFGFDIIIEYRRELEKKLFDEMGISKAWIGRRLVEIVERCTQKTPVLEWNPETRQKEPNGFWEFDANGAIRALHELAEHMDFAEGEQSAAESIEDWLARQEGSKL